MLDAAPYDTVRDALANIYMITELVRVSDSAVLRQGDTVTARQVADSLIDEEIMIPVPEYATPNMPVYIRMRTEVSNHIAYDFKQDSTSQRALIVRAV